VVLESPKPEGKGARAQHRLDVLEALRQHGPLSQGDIMLRTGVSRATVSSLVNELRDEELIVNVDSAPATVGRPPEQLALNPAIGTVLGIDFGQSWVRSPRC
jgi:DNA-binding transcriptional regulator LsrR (DeoR family)